MPTPTRLILDCDPGHDDALAILVAAGLPDVTIEAITTVGGNQSIDRVTRNALAVCTVAGFTADDDGAPATTETAPATANTSPATTETTPTTPARARAAHPIVAAGSHGPLLGEFSADPRTHGASGLDGPTLPAPSFAQDSRHGVDVIIDTVLANPPGTITIVPTGPLTNIATALRREPRIAELTREVVFMGGGYTKGNITPAAEFNMWSDPEAASIVLAAPWPVTMVGLDVTHQALATDAVRARIRALDSAAARFITDLLDFFAASYREKQGFASPPVHDVVALVRAVAPALVGVTPATIRMELHGEFTRGMTVTDFHGRDEHGVVGQVPARHRTATSLDFDGFWDLVIGALARLP
ncbi:MAG: nucleoside hydrolase [Actinomycetota bacterium]